MLRPEPRPASSTVPFVPSAEQQDIISSLLVTTRVAAGAGTGKTTTISHRIRHLVVTSGIDPERILGITFTNKAAQELSDRIRTALDGHIEPNREVAVHTYHGFASTLLREFGAIVGIERDTELITPAFSRQLIMEITHRLDYQHFDPTVRGSIEKLRRLASQLSDNLIHPASVVPPPRLAPDDPWHERIELLATLLQYDLEKGRLGVADFGDLIRKAHQLVVGSAEVAARIAARYDVVLLDEYQDTDPGQRALLTALFADRTPVMAVGDADQTIYEWRGASKENFERFNQHFGGTGVDFPLTLNRRSHQLILDVANAVRSTIDDAPRDDLRPVTSEDPGAVTTAVLATAVAEADWIAEQIAEIIEINRCRYRDVGVLFRKNKDMLVVHDALARHGIPFEVANLGGLLTVPEVTDLHAWLRVIDGPEDSVAAARLLMGARYRLGLADLARLNAWIRRRHPGLRDVGEHDQVLEYTFLEAIDHADEINDLRPAAADSIARFRDEYRHLLTVAQGSALIELCREILDHTGAWADIEAMTRASRQSARLNIHRFLDLAEDWSPLEGRPSLAAFLGHLADLDLEGSEELDTARLSEADAVTLITVHRAKGLEWGTVFLPALYDGNFPSHSQAYDDPFRKPHFLPTHLRLDTSFSKHEDPEEYATFIRERHVAQERRIAYVAVTRAKRRLLGSYAWWNGVQSTNARPSKPSELFATLDRHGTRIIDTHEPPERPERMQYRSESGSPPDPHFAPDATEVLRRSANDAELGSRLAAEGGVSGAYDRAVREFQQMLFDVPEPLAPLVPLQPATSATGLVTYAQCPKRYFWSVVDPLPRRFGSAARRGTEVHRRIELHNLGIVPFSDPDLGGAEFDGVPSGPGVTDAFSVFEQSRFANRSPHLTETPFDLLLETGMRVRGRIDAVYHDEDRWEIVDFKSGRPKSDPAHDVQLQAYAVALNRVGTFGDDHVQALFVYLGGGELREDGRTVDDAWLAQAESDLDQLSRGILDESFEPRPGGACQNCDFLRFCAEGRQHVESTRP